MAQLKSTTINGDLTITGSVIGLKTTKIDPTSDDDTLDISSASVYVLGDLYAVGGSIYGGRYGSSKLDIYCADLEIRADNVLIDEYLQVAGGIYTDRISANTGTDFLAINSNTKFFKDTDNEFYIEKDDTLNSIRMGKLLGRLSLHAGDNLNISSSDSITLEAQSFNIKDIDDEYGRFKIQNSNYSNIYYEGGLGSSVYLNNGWCTNLTLQSTTINSGYNRIDIGRYRTTGDGKGYRNFYGTGIAISSINNPCGTSHITLEAAGYLPVGHNGSDVSLSNIIEMLPDLTYVGQPLYFTKKSTVDDPKYLHKDGLDNRLYVKRSQVPGTGTYTLTSVGSTQGRAGIGFIGTSAKYCVFTFWMYGTAGSATVLLNQGSGFSFQVTGQALKVTQLVGSGITYTMWITEW